MLKAATDLLKKRLGEIGNGTFRGPEGEKVTFEDLAAAVLTDYEIQGRKSVRLLRLALSHLRRSFGAMLAIDITGRRVRTYVLDRRAVLLGGCTRRCAIPNLAFQRPP